MKNVMVELSVSLLGSFKATLGERPLPPFRTKSVQAMLIYLLCQADQVHQRETLMTLLWPGMPQTSAQANLRQTLYRLKKLIPEVEGKKVETVPFLITNRQTIQVNPDADYYLDIDSFSASEPAAAVALYRGDFLADFYLPDSEAFEGWVAARRADYRRQMLEMLEAETAAHIQQSNYDGAIELAQRQLEIDNLRESGHRQLMEAWARNGRRQEALAHYDHLYQLLQDELAIEPEPTTKNLLDAIRAGELSQTPVTLAPQRVGLDKLPAALKHNLPAQTTLFIGRESELAHIADRLADPACRLLTILGAGGMGKTRLGIEAAQAQVEKFTDGVVYVALAPISSKQLAADSLNPLVSALIDALKVSFQGSRPPQEQLLGYLHHREMLVVFDNFEHLLEAAEFLSDILSHAPHIKILTTSRERLNLQEEWLIALHGLAFSHEAGQDDGLSAAQLFSHRAQQVKPDFDWLAEETAVLRICRLVEGMPLGIELAASWVLQLSCREIADEIEAGLDFLATEMRNVPDRHRSIRAIFGYSWQMLTAKEKDVLQKLSVFRGGFDRQAAKEVAGASLPALGRLIGKSLLSVGENGRYAIHELLRQFALEQLQSTPDIYSQTILRHCHYYTAFLQRQLTVLKGGAQLEALRDITADIDNIRSAWQRAIDERSWAALEEAAAGLCLYSELGGALAEGEAALGQAVTAFDAVPGKLVPAEMSLKGFLLAGQGSLRAHLGKLKEGRDFLARGLALLDSTKDGSPGVQKRALSLMWLGWVHFLLAENDKVEEIIEESLALHSELNDQWGVAKCLSILGNSRTGAGLLAGAEQPLRQSLAISKDLGDRHSQLLVAWNLAILFFWFGDYAQTEQLLGDAVQLGQELDDKIGLALALKELGKLQVAYGEYNRALHHLHESIAITTEIGSDWETAATLDDLGVTLCLMGDYEGAENAIRQCLRASEARRHRYFTARCLGDLGLIAYHRGQVQLAGQYLQQALAIWTSLGHEPYSAWVLCQMGHAQRAMGAAYFAGAAGNYKSALELSLKHKLAPFAMDIFVGAAKLMVATGAEEMATRLLILSSCHSATTSATRMMARQYLSNLDTHHLADGREMTGADEKQELRAVAAELTFDLDTFVRGWC